MIQYPQYQAAGDYRKAGVDVHSKRLVADISYPVRFLIGVVVKDRGARYQQDGFLCLTCTVPAECQPQVARTGFYPQNSKSNILP